MDIDQFHHEVDLYSCEVQPIETTTPTPDKNHSNRTSLCALLSINLVYQVQHRYVNVSHMDSGNNLTLLNQYHDDHIEATFQCDVSVLWDDPVVAYNALSSILSSFEIESNEHRVIADKIIDGGKKRLPTVFSLRVNITRTHNMYRCETCIAYWAAVDSMVDEGMRNNSGNRMVPAKKSSVKKMLKRVRVVGEEEYSRKRKGTRSRCVRESETCTVCLEEFGCGSGCCGSGKETSRASCMPCEHVFHEDCIISWLNQSHYCPVCRFEMPSLT